MPARLFDHLVGGDEQRGRHSEAKHPCGLMVDDQLEPARLYDRQIGRLRALEPPTHDLEESAVSRKKNTEKRHKHRSIYRCPIILYRSLAPRTRRSRATYCPTDERHSQSFFHQDCSDIPSLRFQRSAVPPVIARRCSLCSGRAGTGDMYEIEVARLHNVPEPPCCFGS